MNYAQTSEPRVRLGATRSGRRRAPGWRKDVAAARGVRMGQPSRADRSRRNLTTRAKDNAWTDFGMTGDAIFKTVATLHERDFYKTMESETVEGTWQDVYHAFAKPPRYQGGVEIYCKVQILNGMLTV